MLYLNVAQYVRERTFEVLAPAFYHPHNTSDSVSLTNKRDLKRDRLGFVSLNRLNPAPFRYIEDPDQMQYCAYTIETMIDMHRKNVVFNVIHDHDIPEIFDTLDRYLVSLKHDVKLGVEAAVSYARLVIAWRRDVYKHYARYMTIHTGAMNELYVNNDPENNIFALLKAIGGIDENVCQVDPLLARQKPPYEVDAIIPKPKEEAGSDHYSQSAEWVRQQGNTTHTEEPFKFDFDKFVKG